MTKHPTLPRDLTHLQNGRRVWFYGTHPSTAPCRGTVVGRSRDSDTGLIVLTVIPDDDTHVRTEVRGGTVQRLVHVIFPDLNALNEHAEFLHDATPEEVAEWTRVMIELSAMIGGRDEK